MGLDITGLGALADLASTIINKLFPDKAQQEKDLLTMQMQQIMLDYQAAQAQTVVNAAEAANQSIFVAGWRPFVGWICGTGFGMQFIFGPLGTWAAALAGHPTPFPQLDLGTMMPLLLGMLGLGGMRTAEKIQGLKPGQ